MGVTFEERTLQRSRARRHQEAFAWLDTVPLPWVFLFLFAAVALAHWTLLELPYYWDEGGYYIPAALDFYHRWTLIPQFTNAHPPLPNVVLGLLWHVVGYHIVATRLCAAAFAAAALTAVFRLGKTLLDARAGAALALLTAVYPIWFAQSTLAHADIFAAAFTLWGFSAYFSALRQNGARHAWPLALLFSLAALAKETAVIEPAALAAIECWFLFRAPARQRREHLKRAVALSFPVLPLAAWYAYHHHRTGFTFGNPEYLHYNATANFTFAHIQLALRYRAIHLFLQRDIWLPLLLAGVCLVLLRFRRAAPGLRERELATVLVLIAANWVAFSVLGGALLTRYLLPVYPLILLVCVAIWRNRTELWPAMAAVTAAAFISAWWLNPPVSFAPEDNLTYRDMVVVHSDAVHYLEQHDPNATVLTAWPVAADLSRPDLEYTSRAFHVVPVDNFSLEQMLAASRDPGSFDTAVVFTTHYIPPALARYLAKHPGSPRVTAVEATDLSPAQVAALLHGHIVWHEEINGEAAAIIHFDRQYDVSRNPGRDDVRRSF